MAFCESTTFEYLIKTKSIVNELEKYSWFVNKSATLPDEQPQCCQTVKLRKRHIV